MQVYLVWLTANWENTAVSYTINSQRLKRPFPFRRCKKLHCRYIKIFFLVIRRWGLYNSVGFAVVHNR
ncbi:MAG: hypothetical protein GY943_39635 [Chloroflexi bacterium]|nr:hypothetical protein [Chloroflexota bacterium]